MGKENELLLQRADVTDQIANLFPGEFVLKSGHAILAFAFADEGREFLVRLLLHFVGIEWAQLQVSTEHGIPSSVRAMAGRATRLVKVGAALRERGAAKQKTHGEHSTENQYRPRADQQRASSLRPVLCSYCAPLLILTGRSYQFGSTGSALPVELYGKLKLARIIRGSRLAGIGEQRADCGHVEAVRDVEAVGD